MSARDIEVPDAATSWASAWLNKNKLHEDDGGPLNTPMFWMVAGLLGRDFYVPDPPQDTARSAVPAAAPDGVRKLTWDELEAERLRLAHEVERLKAIIGSTGADRPSSPAPAETVRREALEVWQCTNCGVVRFKRFDACVCGAATAQHPRETFRQLKSVQAELDDAGGVL